MVFLAVLTLVVLSFQPSRVHGETVEIEPVLDATLFYSKDGSLASGAGPYLFVGRNSQAESRRLLIAFDVAANVPPGSVIDSVSLRVQVSNAPNEIPQDINVHRVTLDWDEGASSSDGGRGAPSEAGDATWMHTHFPDKLWTTPGGDFLLEPSASTSLLSTGFHTLSGPGLVSDVQLWLDSSDSDFGWLFLGDEKKKSTARRIDSRESAEVGNRPRLVVHFTPGDDPVIGSSWGRIKIAMRPSATSPVSSP